MRQSAAKSLQTRLSARNGSKPDQAILNDRFIWVDFNSTYTLYGAEAMAFELCSLAIRLRHCNPASPVKESGPKLTVTVFRPSVSMSLKTLYAVPNAIHQHLKERRLRKCWSVASRRTHNRIFNSWIIVGSTF